MSVFGNVDPAWKLFVVAVMLIGGEVLGFVLTDGSGLLVPATVVVAHVAVAAWSWRLKFLTPLLIMAVGVLLGWRTEELRKSMFDRGRECGADGRAPAYELFVEGDAVVGRRSRKANSRIEFRSHVGDVPVKVVMPTRGDESGPCDGEVWSCRGWLASPRNGWRRFSEHVLWVCAAEDAERLRAADRTGTRGWYARVSARMSASSGIGLGWCPDLAGLLQAIVLGRRTAMPSAQKAVFAAAGTIHVFAISGLHVMLVMAILMACAGALPMLTDTQKRLVVLPLAVAYVLLTGARPSALRALMMGSIALSAPLFGRRTNALSAWSVTAVCVYAFSPSLVFDVGCALSFVVMLGIVLWVRRTSCVASPFALVLAEHCSRNATRADPKSSRIVRVFVGVVGGVLGGVGVSFAAWLAGTPMAVCVFSRFTVGGLAANVAVVPLSSLVVALGFFGSLAGIAGLSVLACAFNNLAAYCIGGMIRVSAAVAAWPGASLEVAPWGWGACVAWYAMLFMAYALSSAAVRMRLFRWFSVVVGTWPCRLFRLLSERG